jgi:predicted enzyme related to lactoylglutathione lyase
MNDLHGHFVWYELMTTDMAAARNFYASVMGWSTRDVSAPGMPYTLLALGETDIGGLMTLPPEARRAGAQPRWLGYVAVDDVDAAVARLSQLGGTVHLPPVDIPGIGRFAIIADPQAATLALIKPPSEAQPAEPGKPEGVGWHELFAADSATAFDFYAALFGWHKGKIETKSIGNYQPFLIGTEHLGGIFTKPAFVPAPFWLYYFNIRDMGGAVEKVATLGGKILEGPVDMAGGSRIARCEDPQGAIFALMERTKDKGVGYFARGGPTSDPGGRRWSW